jgi:putative lipoprotein
MTYLRLWTAVIGIVLIAGCSGRSHEKSADSVDPGSAPAGVPTPPPSTESVVKGTVTYRERMALPADAEVDLWIMDVTPNVIVAQVVLAEANVKANGRQVPIEFEMTYDPARVAGDHDYGLRAVIKSGGGQMFETREPALVITKGKPTEVELVLVRSTQ